MHRLDSNFEFIEVFPEINSYEMMSFQATVALTVFATGLTVLN